MFPFYHRDILFIDQKLSFSFFSLDFFTFRNIKEQSFHFAFHLLFKWDVMRLSIVSKRKKLERDLICKFTRYGNFCWNYQLPNFLYFNVSVEYLLDVYKRELSR